jgi:hypothetical protein
MTHFWLTMFSFANPVFMSQRDVPCQGDELEVYRIRQTGHTHTHTHSEDEKDVYNFTWKSQWRKPIATNKHMSEENYVIYLEIRRDLTVDS